MSATPQTQLEGVTTGAEEAQTEQNNSVYRASTVEAADVTGTAISATASTVAPSTTPGAVDDDDDAGASLSAEGFSFRPEIGSYVCAKEECLCEVPYKRKQFLAHLKRKAHNIGHGPRAESLWNSAVARAAQVCSELHPSQHGAHMAKKYRVGGWSVGVLPPIPGLATVTARKCVSCDKLFAHCNSLRNHARSKHNTLLTRKEIAHIDSVRCQSLSRQKKTKKLFRVARSEMASTTPADVASRRNDDDVSRTTTFQISRSLEEYDPGQVHPTQSASSDRVKSSFVSIARCEERLTACNITMAEAWELGKVPLLPTRTHAAASSSTLSTVRSLEECLSEAGASFHAALFSYMSEARAFFRDTDCFHSVLYDIGTPGMGPEKKHFSFLDDDETGRATQRNYASYARVILLVACRVVMQDALFPTVHVSQSLKQQFGKLLQLCRQGNDQAAQVQETIHRILHAILFEKSSVARGGRKMMAYLIAACLCVGGEIPSRLQFRRGTQVSPYVSGILYITSCCGLLEMRKYASDEEDQRIRTEAETKLAFTPGAKVGFTMFCELRSMCAVVRVEEAAFHYFHRCYDHPRCGIYRGVEFAVATLALCVKKMQADLRHHIFQDALRNIVLPQHFESKCAAIVDDDSSSAAGYWALSDFRNRAFLDSCTATVSQHLVALLEVHRNGVRRWCANVRTVIVPLLLTVMHIAAGAPGRGTEIGSMGIRNTRLCQRAVFFVGKEIMLVPTFGKTRKITRGALKFISRHLDHETSFLFKSFFLLIHPLYIVCETREKTAQTNNSLQPPVPAGQGQLATTSAPTTATASTYRGCASNTAQDRSNEAMRDNICVGTLTPADVSKVIGRCFAKYDIPFSYSSYRQWQRGIVKMQGARSKLRWLESDTTDIGDREEDLVDNGTDTAVASITQAGHSLFTATHVYAQSNRFGEASFQGKRELMDVYREASYEWHRLLGLRECAPPPPPPPPVSTTTASAGPSSQPASLGNSSADVAHFRLFADNVLNRIDGIASTISTQLSQQGSSTLMRAPAADQETIPGPPPLLPSSTIPVPAPDPVSVTDDPVPPPPASLTGTGSSVAAVIPPVLDPNCETITASERRTGSSPTLVAPVADPASTPAPVPEPASQPESTSEPPPPTTTTTAESALGLRSESAAALLQSSERAQNCANPEFDPHVALSRCVRGEGREFRSVEQKQAMIAVAERVCDVAIVLATGCGKTAVVMGPILYESGYTLWISPLRALLDETRARLCGAGIEVVSPRLFDGQAHRLGNVVLVGPEDVESQAVTSVIDRLSSNKQLNRIVIDEAHIPVLAWHYRQSMACLQGLEHVNVDCQRVLLTATAPPLLLPSICVACGVDMSGLQVIRGDPCRTNLKMSVRYLAHSSTPLLVTQVCSTVYDACERLEQQQNIANARLLIVCLTTNHCMDIFDALSRASPHSISSSRSSSSSSSSSSTIEIHKYHGKMEKEDRDEVVRMWSRDYGVPLSSAAVSASFIASSARGGNARWRVMCATDGFCTGTDLPDIRAVIVAGGCRSICEFWQAAGRGGRDSERCDVIVLYHEDHVRFSGGVGKKNEGHIAVKERGDFVEWVDAEDGLCRRMKLEQFLHGALNNVTCLMRRGQQRRRQQNQMQSSVIQLCDVCESGGGGGGENRGEVVASGPPPSQQVRVSNHAPSRRLRLDAFGKELTLSAVQIAKRRRVASTLRFVRQVERMKKWGRLLSYFCLQCLAALSPRLHNHANPASFYREHRTRLESCSGGSSCHTAPGNCWRCYQRGHQTRSCPVLDSVQSSQRPACRECFLQNVSGRRVHTESEYGRRGACPFQPITKLALVCFDTPHMRAKMGRRFKSFANARSFAVWLLEDTFGHRPALFDVVDWIHGEWGLRYLGIA